MHDEEVTRRLGELERKVWELSSDKARLDWLESKKGESWPGWGISIWRDGVDLGSARPAFLEDPFNNETKVYARSAREVIDEAMKGEQ